MKDESEKIKSWINTWKAAGLELERMKTEELRAMTEEEAAARFNELDCDWNLIWQSPERREWSGLVEQQRIFSKAHGTS